MFSRDTGRGNSREGGGGGCTGLCPSGLGTAAGAPNGSKGPPPAPNAPGAGARGGAAGRRRAVLQDQPGEEGEEGAREPEHDLVDGRDAST